MRVKCGDIVGEVIKIDNDNLKIQYSNCPLVFIEGS